MFSKKKDPNIKTPPATDPAFHEHINGENLQTMLINPPVVNLKDFGWHLEADGAPKPSPGIKGVAPPELMEVTACSCCSVLLCSRKLCSWRCVGLSSTPFCKCSAGDECNNICIVKSTEDMVIETATDEATL